MGDVVRGDGLSLVAGGTGDLRGVVSLSVGGAVVLGREVVGDGSGDLEGVGLPVDDRDDDAAGKSPIRVPGLTVDCGTVSCSLITGALGSTLDRKGSRGSLCDLPVGAGATVPYPQHGA